MAIDTKTMGWIQLAGGVVALWGAWRTGFMTPVGLSLAALGIVFLVMGYHHAVQGKGGHKIF